MSIPTDVLWRGAAAFFPQPVNEDAELYAQYLLASVDVLNIRSANSNATSLPNIEYRSSDGDIDLRTPVYRYDTTPYRQVFQNGFEARREGGTRVETYCDLQRYVYHGGRPTDSRRHTNYVFVSTTLNRRWYPHVRQPIVYRYEIYAPGGIWVAQTLGDRYVRNHRLAGQQEIAFIAGIAPQYIRSAQAFELTRERVDHRDVVRQRRLDTVLYMNTNFNPQSHPSRRIHINSPIRHYLDQNRQDIPLTIQEITPDPEPCPELERPEPFQEPQMSEPRGGPQRRLLGVFNMAAYRPSPTPHSGLVQYYKEDVTHINSYIDSAFRSTYRNEVYIFMKDKYVLVNYAPGSTNDRILNGPHYIRDSFPSLAGTAFAEYGVDASFGSHRNAEAFIFSSNLCALINFAPRSTSDWVIDGRKTIRQMFPFFSGTIFEKGVDAAFESTVTGEAYLFRGSDYALINYYKKELIAIRPIVIGFHCLRNTVFERDIGAAFASHARNQAYLFKGNRYILFHFTPGQNKDYIINGPKEIVPGNWPSLRSVLPVRNIGVDLPQGKSEPAEPELDHDEL